MPGRSAVARASRPRLEDRNEPRRTAENTQGTEKITEANQNIFLLCFSVTSSVFSVPSVVPVFHAQTRAGRPCHGRATPVPRACHENAPEPWGLRGGVDGESGWTGQATGSRVFSATFSLTRVASGWVPPEPSGTLVGRVTPRVPSLSGGGGRIRLIRICWYGW